MSLSRRRFLFRLLTGALAALVNRAATATAALNYPWPHKAFAAKRQEDVLAQLFGRSKPADSAQIVLDIPDVAEDGAVVPVSVSTTLPDAESITLLAEKNPTPLLAEFLLTQDVEPFASTHVKLAATGTVLAVVRAQGRHYTARKLVKVTLGGCG